MLLSHFAVFHFMSCLDTSEWKAFLIIPTVCYILMIDVTIKKSKLIVINTLTAFFLYLHSFLSSKEIKHSGTILICLSVTLSEFLFNFNSLQSDFSRDFSQSVFSPGCSRGKSFQLTVLLRVH